MDQRTQRLKRAWLKSPDSYTHAQLLLQLIREGLLEKRRVLCAGFFGHKPSRLAMPEEIKRHKVVIGGRTLHTEELNDFIRNIFYWPRDIYLRAMLAATKLAGLHITAPSVRDDIKIINVRFQNYINDSSDGLIKLRTAARRRFNWWHSSLSFPYTSRQRKLIDATSSMYRRSFYGGNIPAMRQIGIEFKDKIFRKAIGEEVIPYLLGEWK